MNPNMLYQNPMMPNMMMPNNFQGFNSDCEMRIDALERQIRRLETRVTKLENPLMSGQNYNTSINNESPFNNFQNSMHMM